MRRSILKLVVLSVFFCFSAIGQDIPYGYNDQAGAYFEVEKDTKLYYEIYGEGEPLIMLHGGVYGYIDEFSPLIPLLAKKYKVICLATRGHVKSDIGHQPFSYDQRADDAYKLIQHLNLKQVTVVGFSDGGMTAYTLAAQHPQIIKQMVVMGAADLPQKRDPPLNYTEEGLLAESGSYFEGRKKHMPEPGRWAESLKMLSEMYNNAIITKATFSKIKCPVLLLGGSNDEYFTQQAFEKADQYIPDSRLSIIQGCGHVIFFCKLPEVWKAIDGFLD